jgi:2-hydroxy-3-keto-5-methylthiopentenyl-1-phosphate phosphatase
MANERNRPVLVSDFDGTMTKHDFYQLVRDRWWNNADPDPWQDYLAGRITHFEALNRFFAKIRGDDPSLRDLALTMELDPALPAALEQLHQAGWSVVIASAGCELYIRYLLKGIRTPYVLHTNPGRRSAEGGLEMILPTSSPFFSPQTGIDKTAIVQDALAKHDRVAFAGDGPPDLPPAKLVPGELRFARGHLAGALQSEGEAFHPLPDWAAVAKTLLQDVTP